MSTGTSTLPSLKFLCSFGSGAEVDNHRFSDKDLSGRSGECEHANIGNIFDRHLKIRLQRFEPVPMPDRCWSGGARHEIGSKRVELAPHCNRGRDHFLPSVEEEETIFCFTCILAATVTAGTDGGGGRLMPLSLQWHSDRTASARLGRQWAGDLTIV